MCHKQYLAPNIYIEKMFILMPERITKLLYLGFLDIFFFLPTNILVLVAMIMQV